MNLDRLFAYLDGKTVVVCSSEEHIQKSIERRQADPKAGLTIPVDRTEATSDKSILISTVFLGLNHGHGNSNRDLWFETMIFGGEHSEYQERYETWDEAQAGHDRAVGMVARSELDGKANAESTSWFNKFFRMFE
jgi:hypothetical protein